ncbi:MAG: hypothetical protein KJN71_07045 [Acidimicrobiia bacterium]|nr:hypothetical protein [Acidimicrobiia bacterium]NNC75512.1 hypothetical protein [Acidimicrobiia bacterium]
MKRAAVLVVVLGLVAGSCGGEEATEETTTTTVATTSTTTTTIPVRTLTASPASITVDGSDAEWASIEGLRLKMDSVHGVYGLDPAWVDVKVAHDDSHIYVLMRLDDDYNWDADDPRLSGAPSVAWAIDATAGPAHGAGDTDRDASFGVTDIWQWKLACPSGTSAGGAAGGTAETGGLDPDCSLDDLVASNAYDDAPDSGENSLLGSWSHTDPTADAFGSYVFEFSRPLQTGDADDLQFAVGDTALLALAYWDPDNGPDGWEPDLHVVSSYEGWIEVLISP